MAETYLRITTNLNEIDRQLDGVINKVAKLEMGFNAISGIISSATRAFSTTVRTITSMPGISTLQNLVNSISSLPINAITNSITSGFSTAVERFDTLKTFPAVMQAIGYSADEAAKSTERLRDSVLGLPIGLDEVTERAQMFALLTGNLNTATDLTIALNNAFIASGSNDEQIAVGMRQIQYLMEGSKLTTRQWQSLIRSMPVALRYVGEDLGYNSFTDFTAALRSGSVATDTLLSSIINVGIRSSELQDILETFKNRVSAAMTNLGIAAQRMGESMISSLDTVLSEYRGTSVAGEIKNISSLLDRLGAAAASWISSHGREISSFIDRLFNVDWEKFINAVLDGLLEMGDRAISFIETFDAGTLGHLITDMTQLADVLDRISGAINAIVSVNIITAIPRLFSIGSRMFASGVSRSNGLGGLVDLLYASDTAYNAASFGTDPYGQMYKWANHPNSKYAPTYRRYFRPVSGITAGAETLGMAGPTAFESLSTIGAAGLGSLIGLLLTVPLIYDAYTNLPPLVDRFNKLNESISNIASDIEATDKSYMNQYQYSLNRKNISGAKETIDGLIERYNNSRGDILGLIGDLDFSDISETESPNVWQESAIRKMETLADTAENLNKKSDNFKKLSKILGKFSSYDMGILPENITDQLAEYFTNIGSLVEQGYDLPEDVIRSAQDILAPLDDYVEFYNQKSSQISAIDLKIAELEQAVANSQDAIKSIIGNYSLPDPTKDTLVEQIQALLNPEEGESVIPSTEEYLGGIREDLEYTDKVLDKLSEFRTYLEENLTPEKLEELFPSVGEDAGQYATDFINAIISSFSLSDPNTLALLESGDFDLLGDELVSLIAGGINQSIEKAVLDGEIKPVGEILDELLKTEEEKRQTQQEMDLGLGELKTNVEEAINSFAEVLGEDTLKQGFNSFSNSTSTAASSAEHNINTAVSNLISMMNARADGVRTAARNLASALDVSNIGAYGGDEFTLNWLRSASGGEIPTFGTDTVPTMLTPGEYVHRRAVVQHYGKAFMDRLNNLDLQGALETLSMGYIVPFSTGGLVRSDNRTYRDNHASIVQNFNNSRSDYSFRRANRFVRGLA